MLQCDASSFGGRVYAGKLGLKMSQKNKTQRNATQQSKTKQNKIK